MAELARVRIGPALIALTRTCFSGPSSAAGVRVSSAPGAPARAGAVLRLLIGTERIHKGVGSASVLLTDADAVRAKSKWLYSQMKHLCRCHGLPETEDVEAARAMTRAVNAMFQKT